MFEIFTFFLDIENPMVFSFEICSPTYHSDKGIHPQAPRIINFESFEVSLRQFRI
jgi:hypothetical protein